MERKIDKIEASLKKQTSNYQATARRIVDDKVQYVNDGSRVTSRIGDDPAGSKVGRIKPEEIYGKAPISLTKEQLRDPERNPYNNFLAWYSCSSIFYYYCHDIRIIVTSYIFYHTF